MAKSSTIRKDPLPCKAGVARLIPLDANGTPDYDHAVATAHDFVQSTQITETRTMETLENGNGSSKDYVTNVVYTATVVTNSGNTLFHNLAANRIEELPNTVLVPDEFNFTLPKKITEGETLEIKFGAGQDHEIEPAPDKNGNYHFTIEDSYGNVLTQRPQLENGAYKYDADTKALQFSEDYLGQNMRIIYDYSAQNGLSYRNDPVLKNREFRLEIYALVQSAKTSEVYRVIQTLERCTVSGDIANQITQISKSAAITYTFQSSPMPEGESVFHEVFLPTGTSADGGTGGTVNPVNGTDDVFGEITPAPAQPDAGA